MPLQPSRFRPNIVLVSHIATQPNPAEGRRRGSGRGTELIGSTAVLDLKMMMGASVSAPAVRRDGVRGDALDEGEPIASIHVGNVDGPAAGWADLTSDVRKVSLKTDPMVLSLMAKMQVDQRCRSHSLTDSHSDDNAIRDPHVTSAWFFTSSK